MTSMPLHTRPKMVCLPSSPAQAERGRQAGGQTRMAAVGGSGGGHEQERGTGGPGSKGYLACLGRHTSPAKPRQAGHHAGGTEVGGAKRHKGDCRQAARHTRMLTWRRCCADEKLQQTAWATATRDLGTTTAEGCRRACAAQHLGCLQQQAHPTSLPFHSPARHPPGCRWCWAPHSPSTAPPPPCASGPG